jgi:hypothetical protein
MNDLSLEKTIMTVDFFFSEYVFGFIFSDIQREIDLAREGRGGGNFLSALGLLCCTEVLGGFITGSWELGMSKKNFDSFFDRLGTEYETFRQNILPDDPYRLFRCGMVHQYGMKGPGKIMMLKRKETCGVWKDNTDGRYAFSVEKYFEDFSAAGRKLYEELMAQTNPEMPKS